jgi:hypothetical protein
MPTGQSGEQGGEVVVGTDGNEVDRVTAEVLAPVLRNAEVPDQADVFGIWLISSCG